MSAPEQYLTFVIGIDEYGVALTAVRQVLAWQAATRVPDAPSWIAGLANLRGRTMPVVDLAVKFGLPVTQPNARTCLLVLELEADARATTVAAVVHEIRDVVEVAAGDMTPVPTLGTQVRAECMKGVASAGGRFVLLLDIQRVLLADGLLGTMVAGNDTSIVSTAH